MTKYKENFRKSSHESLEARHLLTTISSTLLGSFSNNVETAELSEFSPIGDVIYFDVNDSELWRSDGTTGGTSRLAEVDRVGEPVEVGLGLTLFEVETQNGTSIWRTDGTSAGTFELISNRSLSRSAVFGRFASTASAHGVNYFVAEKDNELGLYRTDGTADGTARVSSRLVGRDIAAYNDEIYFVRTSGEARHIFKIADANSDPQRFAQLNSNSEPRQSVAPNFTVVNDKLVFFDVDLDASHRFDEVGFRPWATDGTVEGTIPLTEGTFPAFAQTYEGTVINDVLEYIVFRNGRFSTDGTPEGTDPVPAFLGEGRDTHSHVGTADGYAYFATYDSEGTEFFNLSATDGTSDIGISQLFRGYVERFTDDYIVVDEFDYQGADDVYVVIDNEAKRIYSGPETTPLVGIEVGNVGDVFYYQGAPWAPSIPGGTIGRNDLSDQEGSDILPTLGGNEILNESTSTLALGRYTKPFSAQLFTFDQDSSTLWALDGGFSPMQIAEVDSGWLETTYVPELGKRFRSPQFHYAEDAFYFINETDQTGREIWLSDGTPEGTLPFDATPGSGSSDPELVYWNGMTLVVANQGNTTRSLWLLEAASEPRPFQFDVNGKEVIAVGTDGDDSFELRLSDDTHVLTINGQTVEFDAEEVDTFHLGAGAVAGNDQIRVIGTDLDDKATALDNRGVIRSDTYEVNTYTFDTLTFEGGGGNDRAQIFGSDEHDTLQGQPGDSTMETPDQTFRMLEFERVDSYGRGGEDRAQVFGTVEEDDFYTFDGFEVMRGPGHYQVTRGFSRVDAYGRDGKDDTGHLFDTVGDDHMFAFATYVVMQSPNTKTVAKGFEWVETAANRGGDDNAYLWQVANGEHIFASGVRAAVGGPQRFVMADNFDTVNVRILDGANPTTGIGDIDFVLTGISGGSGEPALGAGQNAERIFAGDTNFDGVVDFTDFLAVSFSFGKSDRIYLWEDGDFNGDGIVDFADFLALSENFGVTV